MRACCIPGLFLRGEGLTFWGSVAHENEVAELDLATLKHAGKYLLHTIDGTSTDANLIAPLFFLWIQNFEEDIYLHASVLQDGILQYHFHEQLNHGWQVASFFVGRVEEAVGLVLVCGRVVRLFGRIR